MKFGSRQLPLPLRVGRMLMYLQSGMLVLSSLSAVMVTMLTGEGSSLVLSGPLIGSNRTISGGTVIALAVLHLAVAVVLVVLTFEAARFSASARLGLTVAEIVLTVYVVGVISTDLSSLFFGPVLGAGVIACHYWRSINSRFDAVPPPGETSAVTDPAPITAGDRAPEKTSVPPTNSDQSPLNSPALARAAVSPPARNGGPAKVSPPPATGA